MNRIRDFLYRFMNGRYGTDELGKVTLFSSWIVCIISSLINRALLYYLGMIGIIYSLYRALSRNINARMLENRRFLKMVNLYKLKYDQRKEYKIFKCRSCGRNVRVPRGKGRIEVTCPACGNKTRHRT